MYAIRSYYAFGKDGTVTAGNASGIVDGAAALVIAEAAKAAAEGWKPRARILSWAITGVEPQYMGIGPRITSYNVCYTKLLRPSP